MPLDDTAHMETYTDIVSQNVLQTVACSAKYQEQGRANWESALTDHTVLPTDPVRANESIVPMIDIQHAQTTDQVVHRIHHDQGGEFENRLHKELEKLGGMEYSQLVLSCYFKKLNQIRRSDVHLVGFVKPVVYERLFSDHFDGFLKWP
ncbi:hypothetical protein ACROYT_G017120 [Oculina patagonica]